MVPGEGDIYGVCYKDALGGPGSAIWDGVLLQDLGVFDTEKDARQACQGAIKIILSYRQYTNTAMIVQGLQSNGSAQANPGGNDSMDQALQLLHNPAVGRMSTYGHLLQGAGEGGGIQPGMEGHQGHVGAGAAEDVHSGLPLLHLAPSGVGLTPSSTPPGGRPQPSYVELFSWLSAYQVGRSRPT
eukprot:gene18207-24655_t